MHYYQPAEAHACSAKEPHYRHDASDAVKIPHFLRQCLDHISCRFVDEYERHFLDDFKPGVRGRRFDECIAFISLLRRRVEAGR